MAIRLDAHRDEQHRDQQWHKPVRVAATGNVTIATALNAGDTIDGVTLAAGDRVLLPLQSTGSQNGIYIAGASPARAYDMLAGIQAMGAFVYVTSGTANGGTLWVCTNTSLPTIDTTALTWEEFSGGGATDAVLRYGGAAEWFEDHGTTGTTETIDLDNGNVHWITLDNNCTLTFTGAVATIGAQAVHSGFLLYVEQDGTGGWDLTFPGSVVDAAALSASLDQTAATLSRIVFTTPDGGTTWYGDLVGGSGGSDLTIEDEGTPLATAATTLDFVGAGVTATGATGDKTITIPGVTEESVRDAGRWEHAVIPGSPPDDLYADGDWLYIWVPG